MRKIKKRKEFLAHIPDGLLIKLATGGGDITLNLKTVIDRYLTAISKQSEVKNISYYIKD